MLLGEKAQRFQVFRRNLAPDADKGGFVQYCRQELFHLSVKGKILKGSHPERRPQADSDNRTGNPDRLHQLCQTVEPALEGGTESIRQRDHNTVTAFIDHARLGRIILIAAGKKLCLVIRHESAVDAVHIDQVAGIVPD